MEARKIPVFDINILKNSTGNFDKEVLLEYATGRKKKNGLNSNRLPTQKKVVSTEGNEREMMKSERSKKISGSKITFRLANKPKSLQKS